MVQYFETWFGHCYLTASRLAVPEAAAPAANYVPSVRQAPDGQRCSVRATDSVGDGLGFDGQADFGEVSFLLEEPSF